MQIIRPDTWFCSNWNDCNFKARSAGEYSVNESSWDVWMELDSSFAVRTLRFTWFSCYRPKLMKARLQRWMWPCLRGALFWCNFRRLLKVANFWMILREVLSNTDELCPIFSISFYLSNGFCYFRCIFVVFSLWFRNLVEREPLAAIYFLAAKVNIDIYGICECFSC